MKDFSPSQIKDLILRKSKDYELKLNHPAGTIRFDLSPQTLRLWEDTLKIHASSYNLLLACETSKGAIEDTKLTWVVGSAIRPVQVKDPKEAIKLLIRLGVHPKLCELIDEHCLGLAKELAWAFYLDRKGSLTAVPILECP